MFDRPSVNSLICDALDDHCETIKAGKPSDLSFLQPAELKLDRKRFLRLLEHIFSGYDDGKAMQKLIIATTAIANKADEPFLSQSCTFICNCDSDPVLKGMAIHFISNLKWLPDALVALIVASQDDENPFVRLAAASCTRLLGEDASEHRIRAMRLLRNEVLESSDETRKSIALRGLMLSGFASEDWAIAEIREVLCGGNVLSLEAVLGSMSRDLGHVKSLKRPMMDLAKNKQMHESIRVLALRKLGLLFPNDSKSQTFLVDQFKANDVPDLRYASHAGLLAQDLDYPQECTEGFLEWLESQDADKRHAAANAVQEQSEFLGSSAASRILSSLQSEPVDEIRHLLIFSLGHAPSQVVSEVMQTIPRLPFFSRQMLVGVLSMHCNRNADAFFNAFQANRHPYLDEMLPNVLGGVTKHLGAFLPEIRAALTSESAVARENAIMSLHEAGPESATLTPELVKLYLYGSDDEQSAALHTLARWGRHCQPFLVDDDSINDQSVLHRYQYVQRLLGVEERDVQDSTLQQISNRKWLTSFFLVGKLIRSGSADSYPQCSNRLEQEFNSGNLHEAVDYAASTLRMHCKKLQDFMSTLLNEEVKLIEADRRKRIGLSNDGRQWLEKVEHYLTRIKHLEKMIPEKDKLQIDRCVR